MVTVSERVQGVGLSAKVREYTKRMSENTITLTQDQRQNPACAHTGEARAVTPLTAGCQACLESGDTWVHLRLCLSCGHVGCCDSSKNRHATRHFRATGHPIIRSIEPGETWAYCYEDRLLL